MIETPKIENTVKEFFEAFNKLTGQEKIYFLAQIDKTLAGKNEKDKKMFLSLIRSAREGKSQEEAVLAMKKV
jgi:hypothetical protein